MIVEEKQIEYDVFTTGEEDAIFQKCSEIFENILDTMKKHNCDVLDYGCPECPETITLEEIDTIIDILFNMKDVHTMF